MIESWRGHFTGSQEQGPFPFGFVQLASWGDAMSVDIGRLRMAQYAAFEVRRWTGSRLTSLGFPCFAGLVLSAPRS
jgi:hypothetical protein